MFVRAPACRDTFTHIQIEINIHVHISMYTDTYTDTHLYTHIHVYRYIYVHMASWILYTILIFCRHSCMYTWPREFPQSTATHCNTLQHTLQQHCNIYWGFLITHCQTLQHTATHTATTLQHILRIDFWRWAWPAVFFGRRNCVASLPCCCSVCCSVLQCVAVCCSVLQCVAKQLRDFLASQHTLQHTATHTATHHNTPQHTLQQHCNTYTNFSRGTWPVAFLCRRYWGAWLPLSAPSAPLATANRPVRTYIRTYVCM